MDIMNRPIAVVILAIALILALMPYISSYLKKRFSNRVPQKTL